MRTMTLFCCAFMAITAFAQEFSNQNFSPAPVKASVPAYTVKVDLSNVSNRAILPQLSEAQKKALVSNAFVARPTVEEQLFYIYENNAYKKIGSFVTTDSVLHTYHIFYDFTLRYLEKERLYPATEQISTLMLQENLRALKKPYPADVHTALQRNCVYFAVPLTLLGKKPTLPTPVQSLVNTEITRITKHAGRDYCITGDKIDYTHFIPRGHYTRTPLLQHYFRAMMWYGLVPMSMKKNEKLNKIAVQQSLIISNQLINSVKMRQLWQALYDPTVFYVGKADDLSYYQISPLSNRIFGKGTLNRFDDPTKLAAFAQAVEHELAGAGIENYTFDSGTQGKQFRFMGQRFIPDSRMLQELTYPKVGTRIKPRLMPKGLDVFAVLGSARAAQLLDETYKQTEFANYLKQRKKLQDEIAKLTVKDWQQNLYYGWTYCLLPLLSPRPEGYPSFMRNTAWLDKSLVTALGSWTELRHDTLLYAKQSVAECGEGGDEPPPVPGYVEPEVNVYERLSWLLKLNKAGLLQRNLIKKNDEMSYSFDRFVELTDFLARVSRKELRVEALSKDELRTIEKYGGNLEVLMLSAVNLGTATGSDSWWQIENKTDRHMGLIADVHTSTTKVLEEAVGCPAEIWVVVPNPVTGKLMLTRGAIFTYFEFEHPASDRMTDEAWQQQLQKGNYPPLPIWTQDFLLSPGVKNSIPLENLDQGETGC